MSWRRLRTLLRRETRATLRDPFTMTTLVLVPILALLAFSFVLSTEATGLRLAVLDGDHSPQSRRLLADLAAGDTFTPELVRTRAEIDARLRSGRTSAGLVIPPDFGRRLLAGGPTPEIEVIYDGAEAVLAGNAEASLQGIVASTGARLGGTRGGSGIAVTTGVFFNPKLSGTPFMVAGVFGFVLSFLTTLITAVAVVNERLAGTFDQLQVTPATSLEIFLGKLLPMGAVFALDVVLMVVVAGLLLRVWPAGSVAFFVIVSSFYVLTSLALGLIFSATSATPAEAVQKTVLFSIPLVQLSGFAFPIRNMPVPLQWVTELFPATHYIRVSRGVYLRGEGPLDLLPELAILAVFSVLLLGAALRTLGTRA
ncbi:MAG: ABC transporter permease [bacterium]|nr:ABC transporter permease [bacterium]